MPSAGFVVNGILNSDEKVGLKALPLGVQRGLVREEGLFRKEQTNHITLERRLIADVAPGT